MSPFPKDLAKREYEASVSRDFRWNFRTLMVTELLWGIGLPFATYFTIVPAYMTSLGAPKILIGIVASFFTTLCPLQLLASHWAKNRSRKKWLAMAWMVGASPWAIYSVVMVVFGGACSQVARMLLFSLAMVVFAGVVTASNAVFFAIVTEFTPVKKRGVFFGYRLAGLAISMLALWYPARIIMKSWEEPHNYHVAFLLACVAYSLAGLSILFIKEHVDPEVSRRQPRHAKLRGIVPQLRLLARKLRRDPNYRVFIFFFGFLSVSVAALGPFIMVFAKVRLELHGAGVLPFTMMLFGVSAISSILIGRVADRFGYKIVGVIIGLLLSGAFVIITGVSLAAEGYGWLIYVAFAIYSSIIHVLEMVKSNLSVELRPKQDCGMLVAMANTIMMVAVLVGAALAGLLIDLTGSFTIVFCLAAVLGLVGAMGFAVLVREPRGQKMYVIKYIARR